MYGTIARWRVQEGRGPELEKLANELMEDRPPGSIAVAVWRADADPNEYWVAGIFESREAYTSNAASPEQNERFGRLRELMAAEPEWHDGEVIVRRAD